jgi:alpha-beta hydrolase superfamily lysophospholipase
MVTTHPRMLHIAKWAALGVATVLIVEIIGLAALMIFGTKPMPPQMLSVSDPMRRVDFSGLPRLQQFTARDGQALSYRMYPGTGHSVVVLIHGSSGESSGMHAVAQSLNAIGDTVYVPDLRGHGHDGRPGDIDYIGQLDNDLADFMRVIRPLHPGATFTLMGHSSGGGFVLRIAEGPQAHWFDRFVLLSPLLGYQSPTSRPDLGGWATPYIGRIIALRTLNAVGVRWFNGLPIVAFAIDRHAPVPLVAAYSYRMQMNFSAPRDVVARLSSIKQPMIVLVGSDDEIFYADRYAPLIHSKLAGVPVILVPGVNHMGMVTDPRALSAITAATT